MKPRVSGLPEHETGVFVRDVLLFALSVKCEYDDKHSGSIRGVEFLDKLNEALLHEVSQLVSRH
jgi:hypothetical protein